MALRFFSCLYKQDILLELEAMVVRSGLKAATTVVFGASVAWLKLRANL